LYAKDFVGVLRFYDSVSISIGNTNINVAPPRSFCSAQSRPPCESTIERQIERPIPSPFSLVVKKGSNTLSGNSRPGPKSLISIRIRSFS
jgi:hypothetical protein